jgi:hypothetical protein
MDAEQELLKISDELKVEIITALEKALIKIGDKKLGGSKAQKIISFSLVCCWVLWLKQIRAKPRAKLFEKGCEAAADRLLEFAKEEKLGLNLISNQ